MTHVCVCIHGACLINLRVTIKFFYLTKPFTEHRSTVLIKNPHTNPER